MSWLCVGKTLHTLSPEGCRGPILSDATLARSQGEMVAVFPVVKPGDTLCVVYLPHRRARIGANAHLTTEVTAPAVACSFFDEWWATRTRSLAMRPDLLGAVHVSRYRS